MSSLMPWRGFTLFSTMLLIIYLVYQTLTVNDSAPSTQYQGLTKPNAMTTQTQLNQNAPTIARKFSGRLDDNDGWATKPLSERGGLLWVKYNETFEVSWGISMFHTLHCVEMLRMSLTDGMTEHTTLEEGSTAPKESGDRNDIHLFHCLDYIAQTVICNGDDTLEPPALLYDKHGDIIEQSVGGHGNVHTCKNTAWLWDIVEKSERKAVLPWVHQDGDTVTSIFG